MVLHKLENRTDFNSQKLSKKFKRFYYLVSELQGHDLSKNTIDLVNQHIDSVNSTQKENALLKQIRSSQSKILKVLERKHGIAPRGYYKKFWAFLGVSVIGIPCGIALWFILDSIEFAPVGWALATLISFRIGRAKDGDVSKFGRQLNFRSRA